MTRKAAVLLALALTAVAGVQTPAAGAVVRKTAGRSAMTVADRDLVALVDSVVANLKVGVPAGSPAGTWRGVSTCFRCDAGPALALAASSAATGLNSRRTEAERIFDRIITEEQQPNGSFGRSPGQADIDTMFFATELGMAAITMKPNLTPERYARYGSAVAGAANFLVANGNLSWYTNGNIVVGNALVMALAARLTGVAKYATYYRTAMAFAVAPPQTKWAGFGFVTTLDGGRADGQDSRGYFTEAASDRVPGFDAEYTMLQVDMLSRIYLVNRDPSVLRMINMTTNILLPRVDKLTWRMDTSGGTRRPQEGREFPFDTAALSLLTNIGGRPSFQTYVTKQAVLIERYYQEEDGDRARYSFGMNIATILMSQPGSSAMR